MDFQISVFYQGHYLSYLVSTTDKQEFLFTLKSAPPGINYHPEKFTLRRNGAQWDSDIALDNDFKKDLFQHMKQQKV
jgi:hypothetical protein